MYKGVLYYDNKVDLKFEKELTCQFKIDMRNLKLLNTKTRKSETFGL